MLFYANISPLLYRTHVIYIVDFETLMIVDCNEEVLSRYTKEEFLQLNAAEIRPQKEINTLNDLKKIKNHLLL